MPDRIATINTLPHARRTASITRVYRYFEGFSGRQFAVVESLESLQISHSVHIHPSSEARACFGGGVEL